MAARRTAAVIASTVVLGLALFSTGALAFPALGLHLPLSGIAVLDAGWRGGLAAAGVAGDKGFLLFNGSLYVVSLPNGVPAYAVLLRGLSGGPAAALPWSNGLLLVYPNGSSVVLDVGEPLVPLYAWCGGGACAVSAAVRRGGVVLYTTGSGWRLLSLGGAVPVAAAVQGSRLLVAAALPSGGGAVFAYGPGGVAWAERLPWAPQAGYQAGSMFCVVMAAPRAGELLCFNETGGLAWTAALPMVTPPVHVFIEKNGAVYIVSAASLVLVRNGTVEAYMLRPMGLAVAGIAEAPIGPLLVVYTRSGLVSAAPLKEALGASCLQLGDAQLGFLPWHSSAPFPLHPEPMEINVSEYAVRIALGPAVEKLSARPGPTATPSKCKALLSEAEGGSRPSKPMSMGSPGATRCTAVTRTVTVTARVTRTLTICPGRLTRAPAAPAATVTETVTRTVTRLEPRLYTLTVTEQVVKQATPGWLIGLVAVLLVAVAVAAYLLGERRGLELAAGV